MSTRERENTAGHGDDILVGRGLWKDFLGFSAVRGVDINVRRGSIHALIGPNGAGKTTLFNLFTNFLKPSAGTILFDGRDITAMAPHRVARLGLVRSFQISSTFSELTALENVRVALRRASGQTFAFWRSAAGLSRRDDEARRLLDLVGLADFAGVRAATLPYGRKRSLEIATTLALQPKMLLLDEPTSGMGHEDVERVVALIRKVAANLTILLVEHNLNVVAKLSDRITVLHRGEVLAEGPYAAMASDERVIEAYIGRSTIPA